MADRKKSTSRRKLENAGVKDGTVRVGIKGKTMRKYNAKTGKWDVIKGMKPRVSGATTSSPSKPSTTKASRSSGYTSGSYSTKKNSSSTKEWWKSGGGGLVGKNSPIVKPRPYKKNEKLSPYPGKK